MSANPECGYYVVCSEKVVDLAVKQKWTNCDIGTVGIHINRKDVPRWKPFTINLKKTNWREILEKEIAQRDAENNK